MAAGGDDYEFDLNEGADKMFHGGTELAMITSNQAVVMTLIGDSGDDNLSGNDADFIVWWRWP